MQPLAERGVAITMAVAPPLADLMRGLPGVQRVLTRIEDARETGCDALTFVCSLPHRLGVDATRLQVMPSGARGYLNADPPNRARWRERLGPRPTDAHGRTQRRIGLVWSGRADNDCERRR